ncbi:MAG: hypothetical protein UZ12_BCD005001412 [Bacteroidetes bacterium OLB12]|nr:MAG: hypothetical protein UZ12_BCD005001412 [Bacteroidetes bacterium OLB12]
MHVGEELNMGEELPALNRAEFLPAAGKPETGNSARKKGLDVGFVFAIFIWPKKNCYEKNPHPLLISFVFRLRN